jgi:hypothetical protein
VRRPGLELVDLGDAQLELDPELLQDRSPLRRARGEDEAQTSSGKNSAASRAADSWPSDPCTMF